MFPTRDRRTRNFSRSKQQIKYIISNSNNQHRVGATLLEGMTPPSEDVAHALYRSTDNFNFLYTHCHCKQQIPDASSVSNVFQNRFSCKSWLFLRTFL